MINQDINQKENQQQRQNISKGEKGKNDQNITILFFASAKDYIGGKEKIKIDLNNDNDGQPMTITMLISKLELLYPGIKKNILKSCTFTKNLEYIDINLEEVDLEGEGQEEIILKNGDEIGIIPPVSSG